MRRAVVVFAMLATTSLIATLARDAAAQRVRRRFEPTDLRVQPAGIAEVDVQAGVVAGENGTLAYAPDVEASVGISSRAEIEVDGTGAFDSSGALSAADNMLIALRLALVDVHDADAPDSAWAAGIQAGPRVPTLSGARGLGFEGLAIVGRTATKLHVFGMLGALIDPLQSSSVARAARPVGVEGGIDLDLDLDDRERWSLKTEVGGVKFLSDDASQLHITAGPALVVVPGLELSAIGIVGLLSGGDRYGFLLGATSTFRVF